jgi:hypothetical protein
MSLDIQSRRQIWAAYPAAVDFMSRTKSVAQSMPVIHQPRYVRLALPVVAGTYLPLFAIAAALVALVLTQERRRRRLGWLAAVVLLGYLYNLAACLEIAVIHSLEIGRYITVQMFPTIFVQFLALWFVLEFTLEMRTSRKTSLSRSA